MPTPITDAALAALPWQMRVGVWRSLVNGLLNPLDELLDRGRAAVKARWPSSAPDDALRLLGADRLLPRFPTESTDSYRARLAAAMDLWAGTRDATDVSSYPGPPLLGGAGTARGLVDLLALAGFTAFAYDVWSGPSWWPGGGAAWPPAPEGDEPNWWAQFATDNSLSPGTWPPAAGSDDSRAVFSRVWVEIRMPGPFGWRRVNWGDSDIVWGDEDDAATAGTEPWVWGGLTGLPAHFAFVRGLIRQWIPAHTICPAFYVRDDDTGWYVEMPGA